MFAPFRVFVVAAVLAGIGLPAYASPADAAAPHVVPPQQFKADPHPVTPSRTLPSLPATGPVVEPGAQRRAAAPAPRAGEEWWTRRSHSVRNADGSVTARIHVEDAFRRAGGRWVALDPRPRAAAGGGVEVAGGIRPMRFGTSAETLARIDLPGGPVTIQAPGLRIGKPIVDGTTIQYRDVATDTDLELELTRAGVRAKFVLRSARAPRDVELRLLDPNDVLGGLASNERSGYRSRTVLDDGTRFEIEAPFAAEMRGDDVIGREPGSASMTVARVRGGYRVVKSVSDAWLADRRFPIVLDPTLQFVGTGEVRDCHIVDGSRATTNYCGSTAVEIGHGSEPLTRRLLVDFTALDTDVPRGSTVSGAKLSLYATNQYQATTALAVNYRRETQDWNSAATWNQRMSGVGWTTAGGSLSSSSSGGWIYVGPTLNKFYNWSLPGLVGDWVRGTYPNHGFLLSANTETANNIIRFAGTETATLAQRPYLEVTYTPPTPVLTTTVSPAGPYKFGDVVTYTTTVANQSTGPIDDVTLTAGLDLRKMDLSGSEMRIGGAVCAPPACALAPDGASILVPDLDLSAGTSKTFSYTAVVTGGDRQCSDVTTWASAVTPPGTNQVTEDLAHYLRVCGTGLGFEPWWSYENVPVGPQTTANVNVGSGNLVVQQTDTTPIQARGDLAFVVRRTYNSQDPTTTAIPGTFGAGWTLNVGNVGEIGSSPSALLNPTPTDILKPLALTLVDRDGTRHLFVPQGLSAAIDVTDVQLPAGVDVPPLTAGARAPFSLRGVTPNPLRRVCVDVSYRAPAGVRMSLWRFVEADSCTALTAGTTTLLGFATLSTERLRSEFDATGRIVDLVDGSGNELRYRYTAAGALQYVYEARLPQCGTRTAPTPTDPRCRKFTFVYPTGSLHPSEVIDPAGRSTLYEYTTVGGVKQLTRVVNPDGTDVDYTYSSSTDNCDGAALHLHLLCSMSDPRGNVTRFTYIDTQGNLSTGKPYLRTILDRKGRTTTFSVPSAWTDVDRGTHRRRHFKIDSRGRVGELDEGNTSNTYLRITTFQWDGPDDYDNDLSDGQTTYACRQPADGVVDNNLCRRVRDSLVTEPVPATKAPDEVIEFLYNAEGRLLRERRDSVRGTPRYLDTTHGYTALYYRAGALTPVLDRVAGGGAVTSDTRPASTPLEPTLYVVSDSLESLTPRGNATTPFAPYLTTFHVDNSTTASPNGPSPATACADPTVKVGNTGLVCQLDAPAPDGSSTPAKTRYRYDQFGQRTEMTTPKAFREHVATPQQPEPWPTYKYTYYDDGDGNLAGANGQAAGWLKAVSDDAQDDANRRFVTFAYDAAANVTRTWDRNATAGHSLAEFTGLPGGAPASAPYVEDLREPVTGKTAYTGPWRYVVSTRNQLGDTTRTDVDANGNPVAVTPPRGVAASSTVFDQVRTFDANDLIASTRAPMQAATDKRTYFYYDEYDNQIARVDPTGDTLASIYDDVNRVKQTQRIRGAYPNPDQPYGCYASSGTVPHVPANKLICTTFTYYDGIDHVTEWFDETGVSIFEHTYDGAGRLLRDFRARNDDAHVDYQTVYHYDADGNVTDVCRPRTYGNLIYPTPNYYSDQTTCKRQAQGTNPYGIRLTYNAAGERSSVTTYRDASGSAASVNDTVFTYDADGNPATVVDANTHTTSFTFDRLGRQTTMRVPRSAGVDYDTTWNYDPSGNVTSVVRPGTQSTAITTAYGYDAANRLVETVEASSSAVAANAGAYDSANGRNVRHKVVYDADGNVVATFGPRAFETAGFADRQRFMTRTDYNANGLQSRTYVPRYDGASGRSPEPALASGTANAQTTECPTLDQTQEAANPAEIRYPADVGVCVTTYEYDDSNRLKKTLLPTRTAARPNRYLEYAYTQDSLLSDVTGPSPDTTRSRDLVKHYRYDAARRQFYVTDALGHGSSTYYTADGLILETWGQQVGTKPHHIKYQHDVAGNLNGFGNVGYGAQQTDPYDWIETKYYYHDNRLLSNENGVGDVTRYTYDEVGNALTVSSPAATWTANNPGSPDPLNTAAEPTRYTYTFDNLPETETTPVTANAATKRRTTFGYDPAGRKKSQLVEEITGSTTTSANPLTFDYYDTGQVKTEYGRTYASNNTSQRIEYGYDAAGNVVSLSDKTNTAADITAAYYLDGSPRSVSSGGRQVQYAYDGSNSLANRRETAGSTVRNVAFGRNDSGQLQSITAPEHSTGSWTFTYDIAARLKTRNDPNGLLTTWTWYDDDTLQSQVTSRSGSTVASWDYVYDDRYRQVSQAFSGEVASTGTPVTATFTFAYDKANRLDSFTDHTGSHDVQFDRNSNRTRYGNQQFEYRADNSLARMTDANGANWTTSTYNSWGGLTNDQCVTNTYDGFDRLKEVQAGGCAGQPTVTYAYDGMDRQRTRTKGTEVTSLHYDGVGTSLLSEVVGSTETNLVSGMDGSPLLSAQTSGGTTTRHYLHSDGHDSVSTATTSTGLVACTARFDPYGQPLQPRSSTNPCNTGSTHNDLFYKGGRRDSDQGTYQMGSRTYSPSRGGFHTPDDYRASSSAANLSVGVDPLTANRYSYVNGDPVNLVDPDGHMATAVDSGGYAPGEARKIAMARELGVSLTINGRERPLKGKDSLSWAIGEARVNARCAGRCDWSEPGLFSMDTLKTMGKAVANIPSGVGEGAVRFAEGVINTPAMVVDGYSNLAKLAVKRGDMTTQDLVSTPKASLPHVPAPFKDRISMAAYNTASFTTQAALAVGTAKVPGKVRAKVSAKLAPRRAPAAAPVRGGAGPVKQGAAGVQQTIDDIEAAGGKILGREVTLELADGTRTRPDLFVELPNGQRVFIEVKTGAGAKLTPNQTKGFPEIMSKGATPYGANAADAGLKVGSMMPPTPVYVVHQPFPLGVLT